MIASSGGSAREIMFKLALDYGSGNQRSVAAMKGDLKGIETAATKSGEQSAKNYADGWSRMSAAGQARMRTVAGSGGTAWGRGMMGISAQNVESDAAMQKASDARFRSFSKALEVAVRGAEREQKEKSKGWKNLAKALEIAATGADKEQRNAGPGFMERWSKGIGDHESALRSYTGTIERFGRASRDATHEHGGLARHMLEILGMRTTIERSLTGTTPMGRAGAAVLQGVVHNYAGSGGGGGGFSSPVSGAEAWGYGMDMLNSQRASAGSASWNAGMATMNKQRYGGFTGYLVGGAAGSLMSRAFPTFSRWGSRAAGWAGGAAAGAAGYGAAGLTAGAGLGALVGGGLGVNSAREMLIGGGPQNDYIGGKYADYASRSGWQGYAARFGLRTFAGGLGAGSARAAGDAQTAREQTEAIAKRRSRETEFYSDRYSRLSPQLTARSLMDQHQNSNAADMASRRASFEATYGGRSSYAGLDAASALRGQTDSALGRAQGAYDRVGGKGSQQTLAEYESANSNLANALERSRMAIDEETQQRLKLRDQMRDSSMSSIEKYMSASPQERALADQAASAIAGGTATPEQLMRGRGMFGGMSNELDRNIQGQMLDKLPDKLKEDWKTLGIDQSNAFAKSVIEGIKANMSGQEVLAKWDEAGKKIAEANMKTMEELIARLAKTFEAQLQIQAQKSSMDNAMKNGQARGAT